MSKERSLHDELDDFFGEFGDNVAPTQNSNQTEHPPIGNSEADEGFNTGALVQYSISNNMYKPTSLSTVRLPAGMYSISRDGNDGMAVYTSQDIHVDELLTFPDSILQDTIDEIAGFWNKKDTFKKYKFLHRRGYLFYGPQGSGKSSLVQQIVSQAIKDDRVVFLVNNHPNTVTYALQQFRQVEPNRQVICLFEDIDAIIRKYDEDELLSLLDGESQIDNVLNIATTNYPQNLDKRIISRPRRFDRVIKIGMPSREMRKQYFERKLSIDAGDLETWVDLTEKFSFAACAELVISVKCLGNELHPTITLLKKLMNSKPSSEDFDNKMGFE